MEEPPTCGKGLAEHSVLPAKLAQLSAAMADNLEIHMTALDPADEHARTEHAAYAELATEYRQIAAALQAVARKMAGYRDLPMGTHDEGAMSGPLVLEAFDGFVKREQELVALLQKQLERDQPMLAEMRGAADQMT